MRKLIYMLLVIVFIAGCSNDDESGNIQQEDETTVTQLRFSHNWDGQAVSNSDIENTEYINENGEVLTINRIRHLVSDIELQSEEGDIYVLKAYQLIDLSQSSSKTVQLDSVIPSGTYTVRFTHGFDEEDNVDAAYPDLNDVLWNWPPMLGGGYHYLQFDGKYNVSEPQPPSFNFHHGLARKSDGVFEQNYVEFEIENVEVSGDVMSLEIKMNIAEWFKNPHTWDLNVLDTPLMPNYEAQIMIRENAASVFTAEMISE